MFAETCSNWTFPANVTLYFSIICFRKVLNVLNRSNYKKQIGKNFLHKHLWRKYLEQCK